VYPKGVRGEKGRLKFNQKNPWRTRENFCPHILSAGWGNGKGMICFPALHRKDLTALSAAEEGSRREGKVFPGTSIKAC